jgi:hypothetical protein
MLQLFDFELRPDRSNGIICSGRALIPTALSFNLRPISGSNSRDSLGFGRQGTPGTATRIEDGLAAGRDAVAEPVVLSLAQDRPSSAPARWAAAA